MNHPQKYEEAFARLQEIVRKMEGGQLDIDQITAHMKEAQELSILSNKSIEIIAKLNKNA